MPSMNIVILSGNLTKDPEFRQAGQSQVVVLSLAVNRSFKRGDQWQEETTFVDVEAWGYAAESAGKCGKGCPVLVEGRLKQDQWQDQQTRQQRSKLKVVANRFQSLAPKNAGNQQPRPPGPPAGYQPQFPQAPQGQGYAPPPPPPQTQQPPQFPTQAPVQDLSPEQTDDDIPF